MIRWILAVCLATTSAPAAALPAVQRTLGSSEKTYQKYLQESGKRTFVDVYLQVSAPMDSDSPPLENCLEDLYLGRNFDASCFSAVSSLTSKPLNSSRRDLLWALLDRLQNTPSTRKSFYLGLRNGLLSTHPELSKKPDLPNSSQPASLSRVQELEMKAWRKALAQKIPLSEVALLVNGQRVSSITRWKAPEGVFQWSLISNTHEPLIRLGTFSQFAADSVRQLKPLADANCENLKNLEARHFGVLHLEIFSNPHCVAEFGMGRASARQEHLGTSMARMELQKPASKSWLIPALAILGAGLAAGLRNKHVTVTWPGSQ